MTRLYSRKGAKENLVDLADNAGITGYPLPLYKSGTAPEAAGRFYLWAKDAGYPGAWAVGTPGLAGLFTGLRLLRGDAGGIRAGGNRIGIGVLERGFDRHSRFPRSPTTTDTGT